MSIKPIKIRIQNFQSIDDLEFEINGFTTITGKTNIGKSSIIRAISSAILNKPVGNMVRHGESFCTVQLSTEDWGFKWEKGEKGTNRYYIQGYENPLDSVGRGQIEEISNMGFQTVKIGESKYLNPWYANQYEPVFLLNESGPAVTDFISGVSRLDVLQDAIVISNKEKGRLKDKSKILNEEISSLRDKQIKFIRLEEMKKIRADLRSQYDSIVDYEQKVDKAQRQESELESIASKIESIRGIEKIIIPTVTSYDEINTIPTITKWISKLETIAQSIVLIRDVEKVKLPESIDASESQLLKQAQSLSIRLSKLESSIQSLSSDVNDVIPLDEFPSVLKQSVSWLQKIANFQSDISRLEKQKTDLDGQLKNIEQSLSRIPICPSCDRPVGAQSTQSAGHCHPALELDL